MEDSIAYEQFLRGILTEEQFPTFLTHLDEKLADKEKFEDKCGQRAELYINPNKESHKRLQDYLREKLPQLVLTYNHNDMPFDYEEPILKIGRMESPLIEGEEKIRQYADKMANLARLHNSRYAKN